MKRVHASLRLDPDLLRQANHRAIDMGVTRTELINRALAMFLNGCERVLPATVVAPITGTAGEDGRGE